VSVLASVLARLRPGAVVIYDLDSTLLSTQERNHAILVEFGAAAETPPAFGPVLARLRPEDMGWNVVDDLRRHGFGDEPTLARLRRFWLDRFFRDDYLAHDQPIPGAVEFVRASRDAGAIVCYLTGRDEPNMGRGTRDSLRAHGFPMGDGTLLRLKPRFEDEDLAFKVQAIEEIAALGEVAAAFENEPANANFFADRFPGAEVVFVETVHSPDPPPLRERIVRIKDFR
jgi:hypothetical protein